MTYLLAISPQVLAALAFVTRTTALIALILLYRYFARSSGRFVTPVRQVLGTFVFLLAWVWVASIGDLFGVWPEATALVEYGARWIWVPNAVISVALFRLLVHLWHEDDHDYYR